MTIGAYLMSLIGVHTGAWVIAAYMFVFGSGLGFIMQVLIVAVQNAVSYEDLGVATSNATFFRMIGGSFGTAVFGAIYANVLTSKLRPVIASFPAASAKKVGLETLDPQALHELQHLFPAVYDKVIDGITSSVQTVFLVAVPIAAFAFLLSWFLPERPLRKSVATVDMGEGFGMQGSRSSVEEIQLALERVANRENRAELYQTLAHRAGLDLPSRSCWLLYRLADRPACTVREVAKRLKVDAEIIRPAVHGLVAAGMVAEIHRGTERDLALTPTGLAAIDRLAEARRNGLTELLEGWNPAGTSRSNRHGQEPGEFAPGRRRAHARGRSAARAGRSGGVRVGGIREIRSRLELFRSRVATPGPLRTRARHRPRSRQPGCESAARRRSLASSPAPMASSPRSAAPSTGGTASLNSRAWGARA